MNNGTVKWFNSEKGYGLVSKTRAISSPPCNVSFIVVR